METCPICRRARPHVPGASAGGRGFRLFGLVLIRHVALVPVANRSLAGHASLRAVSTAAWPLIALVPYPRLSFKS